MAKDPYGGNFKTARAQAFKRSRNRCQLCGMAAAEAAHHWADGTDIPYPDGEDITADDLTAVCTGCHEAIVTPLRRQLRAGANRFELYAAIEESIALCNTDSESPELARSSTTTEQPGLTREVLLAVRSQRSRPSAAETEPKSMKIDSVNSNASDLFGSTRAERQRSRRQLLERPSKPAPASESKDRKSGAV